MSALTAGSAADRGALSRGAPRGDPAAVDGSGLLVIASAGIKRRRWRSTSIGSACQCCRPWCGQRSDARSDALSSSA